jgi:hypothetical protein
VLTDEGQNGPSINYQPSGLRTGRLLHGQRIGTVEPVFGNLRHNKRLSRFTLRGREKVGAQWCLYCLVHNIEKMAHQGYGLAGQAIDEKSAAAWLKGRNTAPSQDHGPRRACLNRRSSGRLGACARKPNTPQRADVWSAGMGFLHSFVERSI